MQNKPVLAGDLGFVPLADLFQILGGSNSTGVLLIDGDFSPFRGEIHFVAGEPVDASWGSLKGTEAAYALLGWVEGRFEFRPHSFSGSRSIRKGRMEILLDAMRMLDDGLIRKVGVPGQTDPDRPLPHNRRGDDLPTITGSLIDYDYILSEEKFQSGRRIVSEGSHGNWIWVILEGKALISKNAGGATTPLCYLGEGAFIGSLEVLLFGDHVRTTTVTATGDVQSALLDSPRLSSELMSVRPEFKNYLLGLAARAKEVTHRLNSPGKGAPHPKAPAAGEGHGRLSASASNRPAACGKVSLEMEKFQEEYARLSRTFKSLIQCTLSTISLFSNQQR